MRGAIVTILCAAAAILAAVGLCASRAAALSITQHVLPEYQCGAARCKPSPATAIIAAGPSRVLASGVVGLGFVYGEVTISPTLALTPGPVGPSADAIIRGPDGNPWVLDSLSSGKQSYAAVQDVTPHGLATHYEYAGSDAPDAIAYGLGATWIADGPNVQRLASNSALTGYALANPIQVVLKIVAGPAESMWFTGSAGVIGQITAGGQVLEHASEADGLDPLRASPQPTGMAVGPDGAIWYTDSLRERIGRITPNGEVQEFAIPNHSPPGAADRPQPHEIVAGPEGQYMYFTDPGDNAIGRVSMSGEVTEYPIPSNTPVVPGEIVAVGNELVFGEDAMAAFGSVNPTGSPGEAPLSTPPPRSTIEATLEKGLASATAVAKTAFMRSEHGFTLAFTPPEAGMLTFTWTAEPTPALRTPKRAAPVVVAAGEETFDLAEPGPIHIKITAAGERLIKRSAHRSTQLRLTAHASFSGVWAGPLEASKRQQISP